jgi:hypothetical protein
MSSESFLSRWSRRKQNVREAEQAEPVDPAPSESAGSERAPEANASAEEQAGITPADSPADDELGPDELARLPSLDELTADTDLSLFLRKGVPEALRNAALRRMWSLDPKIRDFVSEAREYAYDWNVPGGVPGSGGALPPADEIRKLAEQIVGGHRPLETRAAEPEGDVGEPVPSSISRPDAEAQGSSPSPPDGSFPDQPGSPETLPPQPGAVMAEAPQPVVVRAGETNAGAASPRRRHGGAKPC